MLMKLTPGLDFINFLRTAFTPVVPQSVRTQSSCQYLFTLLGPTSVKAVRRTLMKLTPVVVCPSPVFLSSPAPLFSFAPLRGPSSHSAPCYRSPSEEKNTTCTFAQFI